MTALPKSLSAPQKFILENVERRPEDIARAVAERFQITRQAANQQLRRLVSAGLLLAKGATKARRYELRVLRETALVFDITPALQEDVVWKDHVAPLLSNVADNVRETCQYGLTEILNNAIDHSGSEQVSLKVEVTGGRIDLKVLDLGVGIFRKIKEACGLEDERHAILELVKGKLTTDPERHSGEGIFFTSRMFDHFIITSGNVVLARRRDGPDWLREDRTEPAPGTAVAMGINPWSTHTTTEVFERYAASQDDYAFHRTHVLVALAQTATEKLISRSQAKRVLARLDRFKEIVLDFQGVETLGPAFADEVFRVFPAAHPGIRLRAVNTNPVVERMIRRAMTASASEGIPATGSDATRNESAS